MVQLRGNSKPDTITIPIHLDIVKTYKYMWQLNDKNIDFNLKWEICAFTSPYRCGTRRCVLCLTEKLSITRADPLIILNRRTELISKCRHRNKFTLARFK